MTFSNEEKTIIGYLLEMDRSPSPNCLANIWEKVLPDVRINFKNKGDDGVQGQVFLSKKAINQGGLGSFDKHLTSTIILLIDLFDRLEKEKLIISFNPSQKHWVLGDDRFESDGVSLLAAIELRKKLQALTRKEQQFSL